MNRGRVPPNLPRRSRRSNPRTTSRLRHSVPGRNIHPPRNLSLPAFVAGREPKMIPMIPPKREVWYRVRKRRNREPRRQPRRQTTRTGRPQRHQDQPNRRHSGNGLRSNGHGPRVLKTNCKSITLRLALYRNTTFPARSLTSLSSQDRQMASPSREAACVTRNHLRSSSGWLRR